jgi:tripartite-type tricarboxylate transporter receptor subunit TctC
MTAGKALAALLLGTVCLTPSLVEAADADVAKFYSGLQMKMIIRFSPGGSYDTYARLLSRHITRQIPGNPSIIAVNMPGASGIKAANYVAEVAPKDGSILTNMSLGFPMYQALGVLKNVGADMRSFNWVGSLNATNQILIMRSDAKTKSLDDAMKGEALVGAATPESTGAQLPRVYNLMLGTKFKVVVGYQSISAVRLALEQKEVDGVGSNGWSDIKTDFRDLLERKMLRPIIQVGMEKEPDLPDVPLLNDLGKTDEERQVLKFITESNTSLGKPFATSPGVPAERVGALRHAFNETMKDKTFLAEADKQHVEIRPINGETLQKIVTDIVTTPQPILGKVKDAMGITSETTIQ